MKISLIWYTPLKCPCRSSVALLLLNTIIETNVYRVLALHQSAKRVMCLTDHAG